MKDRFLGCVTGASIGDAIGGAFEFYTADRLMLKLGGRDWIDDMYPYHDREPGAYGVWRTNAPAGTGTDDTRMNHIFIETVIRQGSPIGSRLLAQEYIDRYQHPERYYPGNEEIAVRHLEGFQAASYGALHQECPLLPDVPVYALKRSFGCEFPTLIGMLALASAGLLHPGYPEAAYVRAYELDYLDIGYARHAVGLLAAMVSQAVAGESDARTVVTQALELDPFHFDSPWGNPMRSGGERALEMASQARDERDLSNKLASEYQHRHPFDPVEVLGVAEAAVCFATGDARRAILIGANHRQNNPDGTLYKMRDNDCTGYVTGALCGALWGIEAFPQAWIGAVLTANREVYGIDILDNANQLCQTICGE